MANRPTAFIALFSLLWSQVVFSQASVPEYSVDEISQLKSDFQKLGEFFGIYLEILPTDSFEIQQLSDNLEPDAESIVAWVEDKVTWVPYRGVLRGADGVLMDRRGNSLDQSLLLAELLQNAGYEVRVARQHLDSAESAALVESIQGDLKPATPMSQLNTDRSVAALLGDRFNADQAEVANDYETVNLERKELISQIQEVVGEQARFLQQAVTISTANDSFRERAMTALVDHWWVQYKEGNTWIDSDPLIGGRVLPKGVFNRSPDDYHLPSQIPENLFHRVSVRVVAEKWDEQSVMENVALEHSFIPKNHTGEPLTLTFVPLHLGKAGAAGESSEHDELRTVALKEKEWLPVLSHSDEVFMESSIYTDGNVNKNPNLTATTKKFSSAISGLRELDSSPSETSLLTAVWLDYLIHVPGQADQVIRRQVFDLLGHANRMASAIPSPIREESNLTTRGLALLGSTKILPSVSWLQTDYVRWLLAQDMIDNLQPAMLLLAALNEQGEESDEALDQAITDLDLLPAELYTYQLLRGLSNSENGYAYLDRPNLVSLHTVGGEEGETAGLFKSIDIVANKVATLHSDPQRSWVAQLEHGVLDTNLEVVAATGEQGTFCTGCTTPTNAASQLSESMNRGERWHTLENSGQVASLRTDHGTQVLGLVQLSIENGKTIVLPPSAYEDEIGKISTWWEIDPHTGQTLGIGDNGWGKVTIRLILEMIVTIVTSSAARRTFGVTLWCGFLALAAVITVGVAVKVPGGGPALKDWMGSGWAKKLFEYVFQTCIEKMLFKRPGRPQLPGPPPRPPLPPGT